MVDLMQHATSSKAQNWDLVDRGLALLFLGFVFWILNYGAQNNPFGFGIVMGLILLLFSSLGGFLLSLSFFGLLVLLVLLLLAVLAFGVKDVMGLLAGLAAGLLLFILIALGTYLYGLPTIIPVLSAVTIILVVSGVGLIILDLIRHIYEYVRAH